MNGPVRLARLLDDACDRHPDKLAIASRDGRLSFAELRDRAARLATAFAAADLGGERVATLLPNGPELIICYLACWAMIGGLSELYQSGFDVTGFNGPSSCKKSRTSSSGIRSEPAILMRRRRIPRSPGAHAGAVRRCRALT